MVWWWLSLFMNFVNFLLGVPIHHSDSLMFSHFLNALCEWFIESILCESLFGAFPTFKKTQKQKHKLRHKFLQILAAKFYSCIRRVFVENQTQFGWEFLPVDCVSAQKIISFHPPIITQHITFHLAITPPSFHSPQTVKTSFKNNGEAWRLNQTRKWESELCDKHIFAESESDAFVFLWKDKFWKYTNHKNKMHKFVNAFWECSSLSLFLSNNMWGWVVLDHPS